MKRNLVIILCAMFSLMLFAQSITDVRVSQNIRYSGNVITDADGNKWVLWEENNQGRYRIFCQKYGSSGTAGFLNPLELELSDTPVKLINAVAASDQGIIILYALEADNEQVDMKLQKIDALGQALWANAGCTVASQVDIKQPATKICANSIGGAYVLHEGEYTTQGNIISGMNLDASGTNIWTAPQESIYPDVYNLKQLLLADNGNLIFCLTGYQKQSFHQVDANGNVLGSNPLFSLTDPIPTNAAMLKSVDGSIMLYTNDAYNLNALGLQLLDANLAPVFSSVKEIPLNIYAQAITAERLVDGGFMLSYHYEISAQEDQHTLKTHRLDSNLDELWASGAAEIPVSGNTLFMLDTATDMASNLWLTACVVDSEYYNGRVLIAKLDENGNTIFLHQAVSSEIQPKSYPKLSVYGDSAMLNWGEHDGDNIMMKRQIFDAQGNELLQDNGDVIASTLAGSANVIGVYNLFNKSIVVFRDSRALYDKVYYQILNDQLNPSLPDNGAELICTYGEINIADIAVSNHNTLAIAYFSTDSLGGRYLYYQEIDDNGAQLYPDGGILISNTAGSIYGGNLGFDGNDTYYFWNASHSNPYLARKIQGQRISNGIPQWEAGGKDLYFHSYLGEIEVQDRCVAFTVSDLDSGAQQVRTLLFTPDGQIDDAWDPDGVLLFNPDNEHLNPVIQSVVRLEDSYFCFCTFGNSSKSIRAQKVDMTGSALWDSAGLMIGTPAIYNNYIVSLQVSDHISLLTQQELQSAHLHRIDNSGNLQFGETGLLMPGNGSVYYGASFVEHDNGAYSFFWIDHSNPIHVIKHAVINGNGTIASTQEIVSGAIYEIYAAVSEDQATLYWQQYHGDNLTYDESPLKSIFATSLIEPTTTTDPVADHIPMISLAQNTPNPFNTSTTISFKLREEAPVDLQIFNLKGQMVRNIQLYSKAEGEYFVHWDGSDGNGLRCSAGVYLYKLHAGKYSSTKKMILLK